MDTLNNKLANVSNKVCKSSPIIDLGIWLDHTPDLRTKYKILALTNFDFKLFEFYYENYSMLEIEELGYMKNLSHVSQLSQPKK